MKTDRDFLQELKANLTSRVCIFIDMANLEQSIKALTVQPPTHVTKGMMWRADMYHWSIDYEKLLKFFKNKCDLQKIRLYTARFGNKTHDGFLTRLKNIGYKLITKEIKDIEAGEGDIERRCTFCKAKNNISLEFICNGCGKKNITSIKRKADVDVEISVDAVRYIDTFDTFVLFSGDSDFIYLLEFLKQNKKNIIIISRRNHIASELRQDKNTDYYLDVWKIKNEFLYKRKTY